MCQLTSEPYYTKENEPEIKEHEPQEDDADQHEDAADMRWQLTDDEKEKVRELQQAADSEGLYYKNLFELAKYVLVVQSLEQTPKRRFEVALGRLRKRHAWIQTHNLHAVDPVAAHAEIGDSVCPQHFVQRFRCDRQDDRTVIATHMAHSPLSYIQKEETNKSKYLAAILYRMDLGAVDMEQARRGLVVATISQGQLSLRRGFQYMRFMRTISPDMKDMHPHTVKAVHTQFPSFVAHLLPAIKHVLPPKVADRIHVYGSLQEMEKSLQLFEDSNLEENCMSASEWARQRQERYDETVAKLSLD